MKVILLDIDGVLATEETSRLPVHQLYAYPFDKECVNVFNMIFLTKIIDFILDISSRKIIIDKYH